MVRWAAAAFVVVIAVGVVVLMERAGQDPGSTPGGTWRITVGQGDLTTDLTVVDLSGLVVDVQPGAPDALGVDGSPASVRLDEAGTRWALAFHGGACDHPLLTAAGSSARISVVIDPRPSPGVCIEVLVRYGLTLTFSVPVESLAAQGAPGG